jgi:hypothetical protein
VVLHGIQFAGAGATEVSAGFRSKKPTARCSICVAVQIATSTVGQPYDASQTTALSFASSPARLPRMLAMVANSGSPALIETVGTYTQREK